MISLACALIVSAPFHVDVKLGDGISTANGFELPIARGGLAVQNAKTVPQPNGDLLYFVSNASGPDSDFDYATGPIAHLRTRDMPRGFAILLTPRGETDIKANAGAIVVTAKNATATPKAESPKADNRLPMAEKPIAEDRKPAEPVNAASTESPLSADAESTGNIRSPMNRAAAARATAKPIDDSHASPMRNFGLLALLVALGGGVIVYGKKRKQTRNGVEPAGIDLVAVKALGGKQRLAIVDAGGDRLLIATSDHGVQLLSKLEGGTGVHKIPADFLTTLQQAEAEPTPTTHVTPVNTSKDLAGLVQLRARRATWTSSEPLV